MEVLGVQQQQEYIIQQQVQQVVDINVILDILGMEVVV
jgi:hypothetical protein